MRMPFRKQLAAALMAVMLTPVLPGPAFSQAPDPEPPPGPLIGVPVPLPDLAGIVRNREMALVLGKALFWDTQAGSDGVACASCHFHSGADNRAKNQLSPGLLRVFNPSRIANPDVTFGGAGGLTLSGGDAGPNYTLKDADFPFHVLADPDDRNSAVLFDMNDVTSSQGSFNGPFVSVVPRQVQERCGPADPSIFGVGGISTRKVEPRNTPTTINAVFNHRNFWDGRANNIFNGVDPFGLRNPKARVVAFDPLLRTRLEKLELPNASLASQAVGPPLSAFEMSCDGRTFPDLGRKLFSLRPLALQNIHADDSVLGPHRLVVAKGLSRTYGQLVMAAFEPKYWGAAGRFRIDNTGEPTLVVDRNGHTQMELNFSMFWGISIMLYESTLVSDQTPFDRGQLTAQQQRGLDVFLGPGKCSACHVGPLFTGATVDQRRNEAIERMPMAVGTAVYDGGFYNIGVRPTLEDLGVGGIDPFGTPLSFSRQAVTGNIIDRFNFDPEKLEIPGPIMIGERVAVDGAFKVPTLRNVELTGPYMHNGGMSTLRQVVEFYDRGGDRRDVDCEGTSDGDTTGFGDADDLSRCSNLDPDIENLNLTEEQITDLVAFLQALTDPRVKNESAPFDHPELPITNGHPGNESAVTNRGDGRATDTILVIPAVGRNGRSAQGLQPIGKFLNLDPQTP